MMLPEGLFRIDELAVFVGVFTGVFFVLAVLYSAGFMRGKKRRFAYYFYTLVTALASAGAVLSNNIVLLLVFWGFLGMLLYLLIGFGENERVSYTAKKAFIIIGGTDALMMLGIAYLFVMTGTFDIDKMHVTFNSPGAIVAYLSLLSGALAKAGAMPFHTWIPDTAEDAPVPVTAFLPASLDKLLGIYLLARISLDVFQMSIPMNTLLMVIGSVTIISAVMMALIQHDMKRLLGYHAVSQVGYMVLGIGTGNPVGIAGGLFHMLNHAVYKSCLFMSAGSVEKKAGTTDLDRLGGLAKIMPVSFISFLIASFAICGIPPFNGFASKWMIYQGIINTSHSGSALWIVWLVAAMFGSALTLASFMKLIHAVFLGQTSSEARIAVSAGGKKEAPAAMLVSTAFLAFLCVIFGVFAYQVPLKIFVYPAIGMAPDLSGIWQPSLATALILVSVLVGFLMYLAGTAARARTTDIFIGGESPDDHPEMRMSGVDFYRAIKEMGFLKSVYSMAEKKYFDVYEVGVKITFGFNAVLKSIHNGVLLTYLAWCMLGMTVLFYVLFRK